MFTGLAVYETGVFQEMAEDVAPIISVISPTETPLLDLLGDPPYFAKQIYHEWQEDALQPDTIVASCAIASIAADTPFGVAAGLAKFLRPGTMLQLQDKWNGEIVQVSVITGNTITVVRGFGGSTKASYSAGQNIKVISDPALEGDDVNRDTSSVRSRKGNYCQLFKEDIIISGTIQAVTMLNVTNEMEYQKAQKLRIVLKNLEKNLIRGIISGNTLGSASAYRSMDGLINMIKTNVASIGTMTTDLVNAAIALPWSQGGVDMDALICDQKTKLQFDGFATARIRQLPDETTMRTLITYYESSYGIQQVLLNRWMPPSCFLGIATGRVHIMPLQGRSFAYVPVAKTGDSEKGMVIGEYTAEVKNEEGHLFVHN